MASALHDEAGARHGDVIDVSERWKMGSGLIEKSYRERINILSDAIYEVFAPIEASAFTPNEWKSKTSPITDYAKNGVFV